MGNTDKNFHAIQYLEHLRTVLKSEPGGKLIIYAGGQKSDIHSWNHAKIVSADGKEAIVGGHNLWSVDYFGPRPVHDVSMRVRGPAAAGAQRFLNVMWKSLCDKSPNGHFNYSYRWMQGSTDIVKECAPALQLDIDQPGNLRILGVARAGSGLVPDKGDIDKPSDVAMLAALNAAKTSIKLSQQDMLYRLPQITCTTVPRYYAWSRGYDALGKAISRGVNVQVVVTSWGARAGDGTRYSNCILRDEVIDYLKERMREMGIRDVEKLVKSRFAIATLRFGPGEKWPNDWTFANHAKMMIVDDRLFYIGSSNFYSADLQEYGYFLDDDTAAKQLLHYYWNPLWLASSPTKKP